MDKIKIGPQVFDVEIIENLRGDDDSKLDGHIVFGTSKIKLDADLGSFAMLQTTWHEILHGIITHAGIRAIYSDQHEITEQVIEAISHGILQVLQDNPELCNPFSEETTDWWSKEPLRESKA